MLNLESVADPKKLQRNEQLKRAREEMINIGNPKAIQQQNVRKILDWVYRCGFSTPDILSNLLGRSNKTHAQRMVKDGWLRATSIAGYPTYYTLTEKGLAQAIHNSQELFEYKEIDPYRVHLPLLHHSLVAQREIIFATTWEKYDDFKTERMFKFDAEDKPKKIPDIILMRRELSEMQGMVDVKTAVEIELTPKWNQHLDLFVTNVVDDLQHSRFDQFLIISDSQVLLDRYHSAFMPGRQVKIWQKNKAGKNFTDTGEVLTLQNWIFKHLQFRLANKKANYFFSSILD